MFKFESWVNKATTTNNTTKKNTKLFTLFFFAHSYSLTTTVYTEYTIFIEI